MLKLDRMMPKYHAALLDYYLFSEFVRLDDSDANGTSHTGFPGNHRDIEPPDPISNSVVKSVIADDSVGFPHVKVGHCQDFIRKPC